MANILQPVIAEYSSEPCHEVVNLLNQMLFADFTWLLALSNTKSGNEIVNPAITIIKICGLRLEIIPELSPEQDSAKFKKVERMLKLNATSSLCEYLYTLLVIEISTIIFRAPRITISPIIE